MTDYNDLAVFAIRKYIWQKLQDAGILNANDYYVDSLGTYLVPIIPSQQVPEFNNLLPGKTYIVYDFEVKRIPIQWWMTEELLTLAAFSQNYDVLNKIGNLFNDLFRRYDESATDVNTYIASNTNFIFHHILIDSIFSPEPFKNEGDYQAAQTMITYSYSRKTDGYGRF
jgi:hypothetical protein